jgi:membrane fusion protein (multidrug efflux system)
MQQQTKPIPPAISVASSPPAASAPSPLWILWRRAGVALFAIMLAVGFVALATIRWDTWIGGAAMQVTDDAYIRSDLTHLSSRIAGEVLVVAVNDYQPVKAGDLLVEVDPADYQAQVAQAEAGVAAAQAALDNLANQVELQYATIAQGEAGRVSAEAHELEAKQEQERQEALMLTSSGTRQKVEQTVADYARAQADVKASRAVIAEERHQLDVLAGTKKQRTADLQAAAAKLTSARLQLGYTKIVAPFDGVVGEREVQSHDYVNVGTNLISVVPLPKVYVIANYRETQLTRVMPGQSVDVSVDTFPDEQLRGHVERIAPASGSQFAILPPDNATGNFTKVVQRIPIRIRLDGNQSILGRLRPGMSVATSIHTDEASGDSR